MPPRCGQPAFALVELVLVVAIIAIIGAIAVPKFGSTAERAREAAAVSNASRIQRAIELYAAEHADQPPMLDPGGATTTPALFQQRLVRTTDERGSVRADGIFGPYIRDWPANPLNRLRTVRIGGAAAGAGTHGWRVDAATGRFQPDHVANASATVHLGAGALSQDD